MSAYQRKKAAGAEKEKEEAHLVALEARAARKAQREAEAAEEEAKRALAGEEKGVAATFLQVQAKSALEKSCALENGRPAAVGVEAEEPIASSAAVEPIADFSPDLSPQAVQAQQAQKDRMQM